MGDFRYDTGVIHGRFQILHNDHLKYLLAGKALCEHLVVGITNPDPTLSGEDSTDPGRSAPESNPLNYFERYQLVKQVLVSNGVEDAEFSIVPFPINFPDLYKYYVPLDSVFLLSIYDDWGRRKKEYFQEMGLDIHVLWEVPVEKKGISSSKVRNNMLNQDPWEHLVPGQVAEKMREWDIAARIKGLIANY